MLLLPTVRLTKCLLQRLPRELGPPAGGFKQSSPRDASSLAPTSKNILVRKGRAGEREKEKGARKKSRVKVTRSNEASNYQLVVTRGDSLGLGASTRDTFFLAWDAGLQGVLRSCRRDLKLGIGLWNGRERPGIVLFDGVVC